MQVLSLGLILISKSACAYMYYLNRDYMLSSNSNFTKAENLNCISLEEFLKKLLKERIAE